MKVAKAFEPLLSAPSSELEPIASCTINTTYTGSAETIYFSCVSSTGTIQRQKLFEGRYYLALSGLCAAKGCPPCCHLLCGSPRLIAHVHEGCGNFIPRMRSAETKRGQPVYILDWKSLQNRH